MVFSLYFAIQMLVILSFILFSRRIHNLIYLLPVVNILTDMFDFAVPPGSPTAIYRGLFHLITYALILITERKIFFDRPSRILFLLLAYWAVLITFSSDPLVSLRIYIAIMVSLLSYPVARIVIKNYGALKKLFISLMVLMFLFVLFPVISNLFKIGSLQYMRHATDVLRVGWEDAQLCTGSFLLITLPGLAVLNKRNKLTTLQVVLSLLTLIIMIISLRRTAILAVLIGFVYYYMAEGRVRAMVKIVVPIGLLLAVGYSIFKEPIDRRIALREDKFSEGYTLTEENRFFETILVFTDLRSYSDPMKMVFGYELFNSRGKYGSGALKNRVIHIDYNLILHGSGIVGIVLYLYFYYCLYVEINKTRRRLRAEGLLADKRTSTLCSSLFSVLFMSILIGLSGQMASVTFRAVTFLIIGGYLGVLNTKLQEIENVRQEDSVDG